MCGLAFVHHLARLQPVPGRQCGSLTSTWHLDVSLRAFNRKLRALTLAHLHVIPQHLLRASLSRLRRPRKSWGYSSATSTLLGPQNPSSSLPVASQPPLLQALDHTPSLASRATASSLSSSSPPPIVPVVPWHGAGPRGPAFTPGAPGGPMPRAGRAARRPDRGRSRSRPHTVLDRQREKGLPHTPSKERNI